MLVQSPSPDCSGILFCGGTKQKRYSGKREIAPKKKPHKITLKTPLIKIDFFIGGTAE